MTLPSFVAVAKDGATLLLVKVQAGARATGLSGEHGGRLKIKISAAPIDGAANRELVAYLARCLGVKQADVALIKGETNSQKTLRIQSLTPEEAASRLIK